MHNGLNKTDLTGEYEDRRFVVTRGDSRIAVTIGANEYTAKLGRNNRFIIDDERSENKLTYLLTKPLKAGLMYNGEGVYKFILQEVTGTDNDNYDLGIADYFKYFPEYKNDEKNSEREEKHKDREKIDPEIIDDDTGKKVWL